MNRSLYARLAGLAGRQHGVVTLHQLVVPGLSRQAVSKRMSAGRLHRAHQGVYAVGHRTLTGHGNWMAAVLAYGPDALLSHLSTLALHGLRPDHRAVAHAHGYMSLADADTAVVNGIPCTSVARTVLDCACRLGHQGVEEAIERAEIL